MQNQESVASNIAREALAYIYHQDCCSRFKYDLRCEVNPGEENNLCHDTKLLPSVTEKA